MAVQPKIFRQPIDITQNSLLSAALDPRSSDPSTPVVSQVWYLTTTQRLRVNTTGGNRNLLFDSDIVQNTTILSANSVLSSQAVVDYVQAKMAAIELGVPLRVMSTANVSLAAIIPGAVVDGVTLAAGDRVGLKDQTTQTQNGVYVVQASGPATRSALAEDAESLLANNVYYVNEGTINGENGYKITNDTIVFGTTNISWLQVAGGPVPQATTTVSGRTRYATQAEAEARSITNAAVTPASLTKFPRSYKAAFTNQSQVTITAATHGLAGDPTGISVQHSTLESGVFQMNTGTATVVANGDVIVDFATNQTGHIQIFAV
jgi:hypothetical protein